MDEVVVIGCHWLRGGSDSVAAATLDAADRGPTLLRLIEALDATEGVLVSTCNRVEAVIFGPSAAEEGDLFLKRCLARAMRSGIETDALQVWRGDEAVTHLFAVAAGLDSAQIGETEIRGQLRRSVREASEIGACGKRLRSLFEAAIGAARNLHGKTGLDQKRRSLSQVAVELLEDCETVALVGATPLIRACAERLQRRGVATILVNRTIERALDLERELTTRATMVLSLDRFIDQPPRVDAIMTAVGARLEQLCARAIGTALADSAAPRVVDFGVPGNLDRDLCESTGAQYICMDQINLHAYEGSLSESASAEARAALHGELDRFFRRQSRESLRPILADIGSQARETLREGVLEMLACGATGAEPFDPENVDDWVNRMARKVSHLPMKGLNALAETHGPGAVEAFLAASDPSLAERFSAQANSTRRSGRRGAACPLVPLNGRSRVAGESDPKTACRS